MYLFGRESWGNNESFLLIKVSILNGSFLCIVSFPIIYPNSLNWVQSKGRSNFDWKRKAIEPANQRLIIINTLTVVLLLLELIRL